MGAPRSTALVLLALGTLASPVAAQEAAEVDAQIAEVLAEIERSEAREARVQAEIGGLGERRDAARARLRARVRALYRLGRSGLLPVAGGFPALVAHAARVERLERMVKEDARALASLARRGDALRAETGNLAATLEAAQRRLRSLEERKQEVSEEERFSALFDAAFGESSYGGSWYQPGSYGSFRVVDEPERPGFESQRGRLGMPVSRAADVRTGARQGSSGLEFLVMPSTLVRAAADGRVAFAGPYGAYGRLVIVDHGDQYFTVYGGLGRIDVRVGDTVSRGAVLGDVGESGASAGMFFEVRRGTRAIDAASWLGL